jgi:hypothetical protein
VRKYFFLAVAILLVSPLAWALSLNPDTAPLPYRTPSLYNKWLERISDKRVQPYTLDELYNLQVNYPDEKIIDLSTTNYTIQFTSESVEQYLGLGAESPERYLREISGRVLALILYRLGGDGTDHYKECQSSVVRRLPQRNTSAYIAEWSATFSGLIVDFEGVCAELGGSSAHYVLIEVTYDPLTQKGILFVGGEDISGIMEPRLDLFGVQY